MAIATRVVGIPLVPTTVAPLEVTAEQLGATGHDGMKGTSLLNRQGTAETLKEVRSVLAKDIGHFEPMACHDAFFLLVVLLVCRRGFLGRAAARFVFLLRSSSKSKGLGVDSICFRETCV